MKSIIIILLSLFPFTVFSQNVNCNTFLQSKYLEVGINWNGAIGSSELPPSTGGAYGSPYHATGGSTIRNTPCTGSCPTGNLLGIVADPDKDGWTVGTPYAYYGDYMMPGTPQEGWSIEVDTIVANNWNIGGCGVTADISGANTTYTSQPSGIWLGSYSNLEITQTSTLHDTLSLTLSITVKIKNKDIVTKHGVYYLRTIDPDNAEFQTGSYGTINKIQYQLPNSKNRTLVSTLGTNSAATAGIASAYLSLGTSDCRAKCFRMNSGLAPTGSTLRSLYAATDTIDKKYTGTDTLDAGIGLVFSLGDIAPGDSIVFTYAYFFNPTEEDTYLSLTKTGWSADGDPAIHISRDTFKYCNSGPLPITLSPSAYTSWSWSSPTGTSFTSSGSSAIVNVDTTTAIVYAIGSSSSCQSDTVIIILSRTFNAHISITGPTSKKSGLAVIMNAAVTTNAPSYKIIWTKNRSLLSITTTPTTSYIKTAGIDTIHAALVDIGSACHDTVASNTWYISDATAVNIITSNATIYIYPNPVKNEMTIVGLSMFDKLIIYDQVGRQVSELTATKDGDNIFSTTRLLPGFYVIHVFDDKGASKTKLSVQKL